MMRIGIDVNGVLRDTLGKFDQLYEKHLIEKPDDEVLGQTYELDMSGNMTVAGDVTAYSDARVKENVKTIENALDKTLALRGVSYNRTDSEDVRTKIGVIAQETLEVVPEVVNQDNDGMYNVSYGNMTALLIEAIKEQQAQIEDLKSEIKKLRGE